MMILNVLLKNIGNSRWLLLTNEELIKQRNESIIVFNLLYDETHWTPHRYMLIIIQVYEALRIRRSSCSDTAGFTWFHREEIVYRKVQHRKMSQKGIVHKRHGRVPTVDGDIRKDELLRRNANRHGSHFIFTKVPEHVNTFFWFLQFGGAYRL